MDNNGDNPVRTAKMADILKLMIGNSSGLPMTSFSESVVDTKSRIDDCMSTSAPVKSSIKDSYGNTLTATGTADKVKSFTSYGFSNDTLNWSLWLALYNDSWLFKKVIDKFAEDMIDCGIKLSGKKDKKKIYSMLFQLKQQLIDFCKWGRLFGGSVAVMQFDNFDDDDYMKSLKKNEEKIKKCKKIRLYVTDRWYGLAQKGNDNVDDMTSYDFGKPKAYNVTLANGETISVLHDYVLRFENRSAPNLVKNGMLQGWGYAEGAHILNELSRDDQLKSAITSLVNKSLIEVIKMSGMRSVFMGADPENEDQLRQRLEMVNWGRSFNSLTFLDIDDEYQEHGFGGLGGLSDLMENNMVLVSAACDMPGVLFGDLSQGFAVDHDAMKRYAGCVHNRCEASLRIPMTKLLQVLFMIEGIDEDVDFEFMSIDKDGEEKEQVEKLKEFQGLLSLLMSDGILNVSLYAKAFQKYAATGVIDFDLNDETIKKLEKDYAEELEGIDLDEDKK